MPEHKNMCDGCERKLPIIEGMHKEPSTYGWTYCTKDRYVPTEHECKEDFYGLCYVCEKNMLVPTTDQEVDIWEKEFFGKFGANKIWVAPSKDNVETIHEIYFFIKNTLRLAVEEAEKRGYEKGVDGALRGRIERMDSITIKETVNVPKELREYLVSEAVKKEREEIIAAVGVEDKGMYRTHLDCPNDGDMYAGIGYREAKEDIVKLIRSREQ